MARDQRQDQFGNPLGEDQGSFPTEGDQGGSLSGPPSPDGIGQGAGSTDRPREIFSNEPVTPRPPSGPPQPAEPITGLPMEGGGPWFDPPNMGDNPPTVVGDPPSIFEPKPPYSKPPQPAEISPFKDPMRGPLPGDDIGMPGGNMNPDEPSFPSPDVRRRNPDDAFVLNGGAGGAPQAGQAGRQGGFNNPQSVRPMDPGAADVSLRAPVIATPTQPISPSPAVSMRAAPFVSQPQQVGGGNPLGALMGRAGGLEGGGLGISSGNAFETGDPIDSLIRLLTGGQ